MKLMSEFPAHILAKGNIAREALTAEGKSEEEITEAMGTTFKFKDNRLKYFMSAMTVAKESTLEKLFRVRVVSYGENDTIPETAVQVDDVYFLAQENPFKPGSAPTAKKPGHKGGKKDRPKGPKPSPWGESPEEIAMKKAASKKAAEEKAAAN